jgi:AraC family transcriptional regulator, transcriptional activator of the genes for pyochelin and ferripyochelin receptors
VITPEIQLALRQLLRCSFQGTAKRTYLPIQMNEVDRIHEARKILLQRIDQPSSLIELARLVGLNSNARPLIAINPTIKPSQSPVENLDQ